MSEAPEKAYLYWTGNHLGLPCGHTNSSTEYIRKDVSDALIAAACEDADGSLDTCQKCGAPRNNHHYRHPFVSAHTPKGPLTNARQALDALLKAEREKALREAAQVIDRVGPRITSDAILALISKDTTDAPS